MTFEERMDALSARIEALTNGVELRLSMQADEDKRQNEAIARAAREMAALRESQAKTERTLRRAIDLSVREARNERQKRQELAQRQQESADLANQRHQEMLTLLRAFLERTGNGQH